MKKTITNTLKAAVICLPSMLVAQGVMNTQIPFSPSYKSMDIKKNITPYAPAQSQSATARWYNYANYTAAYLDAQGITSSVSGSSLFPDSTILFPFSDGSGGTVYSGPFIHNIGEVIDPSSQYFNDASVLTNLAGELQLTKNSTYKIDSVSVQFFYTRNMPSSVVDTLIIEVQSNQVLNDYYFGPTLATNYNTDTVWFHFVPYAYQTNTIASTTNKRTLKIPLDSAFLADTLPDGSSLVVKEVTGLANNGPNRLSFAAVKFKPGYSWVANVDTLTQKNRVTFLSYEEFGDNTYAGLYTKRDWNCSSVITTDIRYNQAGGNNGLFYPSYGFTQPYSFEHHWIGFHLTGVSNFGAVSTNDVFGSNVLLGDAYPNPAVEGAQITIPMTLNNSGDIQVRIFNAIGQEVLSSVRKSLNTGFNAVNIDTQSLNAGIYFYSVEQNGKSTATKRFSLVK